MTLRNLIPAAAAAAAAALFTPAAALAQAAGGDAEIQAIRAEMTTLAQQQAALAQRLDRLEAARGQAPASPPDATPAPPPVKVAAAGGKPAKGLGDKVPPAPTDHALKGGDGGFEIAVDSKSSKVSVKFADSGSGADMKDGVGWSTGWSRAWTLTAPVAKGDPRTTVGTLNSLADSTSLDISYTLFWQKIASGGPGKAAIEETARRNCRAHPKSGDVKECEKPSMQSGFILAYDKDEYETYKSGFFPAAPAVAAGFDAGVGYKQFKFIDPATDRSATTDRAPWNAGVHGTVFAHDFQTSLTGAVSYQYAFKDQRSAALCPAAKAGAAFTLCPTGPIGKPKKDDTYQASLELRHLYRIDKPALPWLSKVGVAPQVTYDLDTHQTAIDFPIYIVPDSKSALLGGIRLGYTTEDHDLVVGAFIGSPFSIF